MKKRKLHAKALMSILAACAIGIIACTWASLQGAQKVFLPYTQGSLQQKEEERASDEEPDDSADDFPDQSRSAPQGEGAGHKAGALSEDKITKKTVRVGVAAEAAEVLFSYKREGSCVLVRSGYLDFVGEVWSCIVQGDGWVDLCVVRGIEDGAASELTQVRMDVSLWQKDAERSLGG